jgi:methyl-accepting chemotaxis protein
MQTWQGRALVFFSELFRKTNPITLENKADEVFPSFESVEEENQKLIKNLEGLIERNFSSVFTRTTQNSWTVLLRNANDGGANSVVSTYVLHKMSKQMDIANQCIQSMLTSSLKMSQVISTLTALAYEIKRLSDHSKIVSLNAFMEATHAGEFEKNFSQVAKELSDLSDRIKKVSLKIYRLLTAINLQVINNSVICGTVADIFVFVEKNLSEFSELMIKIEHLSSSQTKQFSDFEFEMNQIYQSLHGNSPIGDSKHNDLNNADSKKLLKFVA